MGKSSEKDFRVAMKATRNEKERKILRRAHSIINERKPMLHGLRRTDKYYCAKCGHKHLVGSKIGKEHLYRLQKAALDNKRALVRSAYALEFCEVCGERRATGKHKLDDLNVCESCYEDSRKHGD